MILYQRRRTADFRTLAETPQGRHLFGELARVCGANRTSFSTDPATMAFNEGRRWVWLHVQRILGWDPSQVTEVIQEVESIQRNSMRREAL